VPKALEPPPLPEAAQVVVTQASVPEAFEVLPTPEFDDSVILRSKACPQIGVIAQASMSEEELQSLLSQIEDNVVAFFALLENVKKEYGFNVFEQPDGSLYVQQPEYTFYRTFLPFDLSVPEEPRAKTQLN
jgi:hypothetical protein